MTQATNFSVPTTGPATPDVMFGRIDNNFEAALTGHSGDSRPTYAEAGTVWQDTSVAGLTRVYFYDGSEDILLCEIDTSTNRVERAPQPLVDIASASSMDLGAIKSENLRVTGTTGPTSFGTARLGTFRRLYFAAALTITRNATSLETPPGANLSVSAGDQVEAVSLGSGNWRILSHLRIAALSQSEILALFNAAGSAPVYAPRAWCKFNGTGTLAVAASGNVTTVADNGSGDYTVNYTTALQDANAAVLITAVSTGSTALIGPAGTLFNSSSSGCRFQIRNSANALTDVEHVNFAAIR